MAGAKGRDQSRSSELATAGTSSLPCARRRAARKPRESVGSGEANIERGASGVRPNESRAAAAVPFGLNIAPSSCFCSPSCMRTALLCGLKRVTSSGPPCSPLMTVRGGGALRWSIGSNFLKLDELSFRLLFLHSLSCLALGACPVECPD
jgi:hypothetical protein